ncbi:MAG TPA: exodeoxyribonuclease VII large subunit [Aggregatilineaceae bacterium]|nr:exodeoxyribonuclease VII large subunit [Aggregatilineaceae bacterium]
MTQTYTVYELTATIRDLIDSEPSLQDIWITGEVSNFKRHTSGHIYFTLKDEESELTCVMWRSDADRLLFEPRHGDAVLAHGRIGVYEKRGQYQLYCDALQPTGVGELNRQFELLKARLEAEGLFDSEHKRPLPRYPRSIGIVTSPTTAAFQDMQNVLRRRYTACDIILSPTPVQGVDAPPQIVEALRMLNDYTDVDVIIVARGGGSLEDLWCFNDERVVRAVAASRIPVVTGVGHEIDFTLVDFAADFRAPTPSAAAELVTPDGVILRNDLQLFTAKLDRAFQDALDRRRQVISAHTRLLTRLSPQLRVQNARQRIDELVSRMDVQVQHRLARHRDRLSAQHRALEAASPLALLKRGYAIVTRTGDAKRLSSVQQAAEGTSIQVTLHDGRLTATVRSRETQN